MNLRSTSTGKADAAAFADNPTSPQRRTLLCGAVAGMLVFALPKARASQAASGVGNIGSQVGSIPVARHYDLTLDRTAVNLSGESASAITLNGTIPGPLLHFREGDEVSITLANRLDETTAIHWHGLLVPNAMDGVPGVTFPGIHAGETFQYKFKLRQNGTYWYHSHAVLEEPAGFYAPLIIDAAEPEPFAYDRDYVILLSDWIDTPPEKVLANLKKSDGYYNYRRQTLSELFARSRAASTAAEREAIWRERLGWAQMRMDPTDYGDGGPEWQFLMQGKRVEDNWTALFAPGERIRLRIINGAAMNFFDLSIPGLDMTVVAADGQNVRPVSVRELRIGNGETYDVIVQPREHKAYTIFAATMARIGFARGTLAPEAGMEAPIPALGPRPVRTMNEMGGVHGGGGHAQHGDAATGAPGAGHEGHSPAPAPMSADDSLHMEHAHHGLPASESMGAMAMPGDASESTAPAAPVEPVGHVEHIEHTEHVEHVEHVEHADHVRHTEHVEHVEHEEDAAPLRVIERLSYADLRALEPRPGDGQAIKVIAMDLTGDMQRYFWSINGKKLSEATFFEARVNQPLRFHITNKTMMEHPMHLHGAFFTVDNGQGDYAPRKHTVIIKPGETITVNTAYDEKGAWVFHCHLFYHAATGMVQAIVVT